MTREELKELVDRAEFVTDEICGRYTGDLPDAADAIVTALAFCALLIADEIAAGQPVGD